MKALSFVWCLVFASLSFPILADDDDEKPKRFYASAGLFMGSYERTFTNERQFINEDGDPETARDELDSNLGQTGLLLKAGWYFKDNSYALELRAVGGVAGDTLDDTFVEIDVDLATLFGGYIRRDFANEDGDFIPYLILGATQFDLDVELSNGDFAGDDSFAGVSYGAGVDIQVSDKWFVNIELMRYYDKDDDSLTSFGLAATRRF